MHLYRSILLISSCPLTSSIINETPAKLGSCHGYCAKQRMSDEKKADSMHVLWKAAGRQMPRRRRYGNELHLSKIRQIVTCRILLLLPAPFSDVRALFVLPKKLGFTSTTHNEARAKSRFCSWQYSTSEQDKKVGGISRSKNWASSLAFV